MLKKYATSDSLRLVGKAWEIRHSLRQDVKRKGTNVRLADVLPPKQA
jgi:hypothetical protein